MKDCIKARIKLDKDFKVGEIDDRIYGSFVEHMGRVVYEGIYEPGHPAADSKGFRQDVMELVKELNVPIVRYPGGNFVSGYNWEDGVGPKEERPRRLDLAWRSTETNQFGTNEFMDWCSRIGTEPMMAVNLGTRGMDEARSLVEYCNIPGGSFYSDLRIKHGWKKPHDVRLWCLGNEMDGPWQIGHKTAQEYGRLAAETAKVMKWVDETIELVACGSSNSNIGTYPEWDRTVLEHTYDHVEYISLHSYYGMKGRTMEEYMAVSIEMDDYIRRMISVCDYVRTLKRGSKDIYLSFDEWNVTNSECWGRVKEPWEVAPHIGECKYNLANAVVTGTLLNALIRHADRVKVACQAQLVNLLGPIITDHNGNAWRQSIYWPVKHASIYGRGTSLLVSADSPKYSTNKYDDIPYLDTAAVLNKDKNELTIFSVNRSLEKPMQLSIDMKGVGSCRLQEHIMLHHDLAAINTPDNQNTVVPSQGGGGEICDNVFEGLIPPHSWNVLRFDVKDKI